MNRLRSFLNVVSIFAFSSLSSAQIPSDLKDLGMFKFLTSKNGVKLQAHDDNGQLHASVSAKEEQHPEETWVLIEVNKEKHIYAFLSVASKEYLSMKDPTCVRADSPGIGDTEKWVITSGRNDAGHLENGIRIQPVTRQDLFLQADNPGNNHCGGGEVLLDPSGYGSGRDWPGWWIIESSGEVHEKNGLLGSFCNWAGRQITAGNITAAIAAF